MERLGRKEREGFSEKRKKMMTKDVPGHLIKALRRTTVTIVSVDHILMAFKNGKKNKNKKTKLNETVVFSQPPSQFNHHHN